MLSRIVTFFKNRFETKDPYRRFKAMNGNTGLDYLFVSSHTLFLEFIFLCYLFMDK